MMDVFELKLISMAAILAITVIAGLLPLRLQNREHRSFGDRILAYFSFFTGGVFLGAGLLHMLPDAAEQAEPILDTDFPWVYLAAACGFVLVWSLDQLHMTDAQPVLTKSQSVAITTGALDRGADICYVTVAPVTTYGGYASERTILRGAANDDTVNGTSGYGTTQSPHTSNGYTTPKTQQRDVCAHDHPVRTLSMLGTASSTCEETTYRHARPERSTSARTAIPLVFDEGGEGDAAKGGMDTDYQKLTSPAHRQDGGEMHDHAHGHGEGQERVSDDFEGFVEKEKHGHGHPESHHHLVIEGNGFLLPLLLAIVFSVHSFVAGLALGVQDKDSAGALSLLIAILSHKAVEALAVGSNFVKERVSIRKAVPIILVYCFMTPLGIAIGMLLTSLITGDVSILVQSMMQAVAGGSFLYLAVHEISDEHSAALVTHTLHRVLLLSVGIASMAVLAIWT